MGGSTTDVSWKKPFGGSALGSVTGDFGMGDPVKQAQAGQKILGSNNMDTNPVHSSAGGAVNEYIKAQTGGQVNMDPATNPFSWESLSKPSSNGGGFFNGVNNSSMMDPNLFKASPAPGTPLNTTLAPTSSVGPNWGTNYSNQQNSIGLENSLKNSLKANTPKNTQFGINLEQNPFGKFGGN